MLPRSGEELAYIRAAVLNGCRSVLRRRVVARRPGRFRDVGDGWATSPSAEAEAIHAEDHRQVLTALARLPSRRREVLVLRYFAGLSESEIAGTLGISAGTVKSAAARPRRAGPVRLLSGSRTLLRGSPRSPAILQAIASPDGRSVLATTQRGHEVMVSRFAMPTGRQVEVLYRRRADSPLEAFIASDGSAQYLIFNENVGAVDGWINRGRFHSVKTGGLQVWSSAW